MKVLDEPPPDHCQRPGQRGDLNEAVDQALAEFSIPYHLGEFLVEKNVRLLPVDFGMGQREVEGHELGEASPPRTCCTNTAMTTSTI